MRVLASVVAVAAIAGGGCAGPCRRIARERVELLERTAAPVGPSARIRIPLALANRLLSEVVAEQPAVPLGGGLLALVDGAPELQVRLREVALVPAPAGKIGVAVRVELGDDTGELLGLHGRTDVEAVVDPAAPSIAIAIRWDQLASLEPTLGERAAERAAEELARRIPEAVRAHLPRLVIDRAARMLVEKGAGLAYKALRATLLVHLGEVTRLHIALPPMPVARVDIAPVAGEVPALDLAIATTLPVRVGVGAPQPATADAINVEISGSAAAELANWSIAHGLAPAHYTRELMPDPEGAYVPLFDWRADGAHPLVVHMFRTRGSCAHFVVGMQPHVEVTRGQLRAYIANKRLEGVEAAAAFAMFAHVTSLLDPGYTEPKGRVALARIAIGDREVTTRLVRATIGDGDLRLAVAVELGARHAFHAPARTPAASTPIPFSRAGCAGD